MENDGQCKSWALGRIGGSTPVMPSNDRNMEDLTPPGHILIVEDDAETRRLLARLLKESGYEVSVAQETGEAWNMLARFAVDIILLDVMLLGMSGVEFCLQLRRRGISISVIMVTARGGEEDCVVGLDSGADDYLSKPFSRRELLARVRAQMRRRDRVFARPRLSRIRSFGGWKLDTLRRELTTPEGMAMQLSGAEHDLLTVFLDHAGRVLSRERLLELARRRTSISPDADRSIDVLVGRLRRKLEPSPSSALAIRTIRGVGYSFILPISEADDA